MSELIRYFWSLFRSTNILLSPEKEFPRSLASVWVMRMFIRGYALFGIIATPYMVIVDVP